MLLSLLFLFLLQRAAHSQYFSFDYTEGIPGLQVDSTGRTFLTADNYLYRLNAQLIQEERVDLGAVIINEGLALSSTGMLVVCLFDLSCSVYNTSDLSAGPIRSVSNAIGGDFIPFGAAIFMSGDNFYTGAMKEGLEVLTMVLQQFGEDFNRSSDSNSSGTRNELVVEVADSLARYFYAFGGFVSGGFAYYVVVDSEPVLAQAIKLLRICIMPDCGGPSTCGVTALYELGFDCGFQSITDRTNVCAVSLMEDFSGISGPTAVVTLCSSSTNSICVVNITAVNEAMDAKYDSCIVSRTAGEDVGLQWGTDLKSCDTLPQPQVCIPLLNYTGITIAIHMHTSFSRYQ